jgi:acetylornithine aminotransferase
MVVLAKALGGGLPLGAVVAGTRIEGVVRPGHHGTTFGGNPLACRLGLEVLREIDEADLLARIEELGTWLGKRLKRLKKRRAEILEVRGRGLMWGIELDRESGPVARRLLEKGFVVGTARKSVLRLLPPYVIPKVALARFIDALDATLEDALDETLEEAHEGILKEKTVQ